MFFSIEPQKCDCDKKCVGDLPYKWTYKSGVFPGQFECVLGRGGEGVVIQGSWHGKDAAFKFSPHKHTKKDKPLSKKQLKKYIESVQEEHFKKKIPLDQALTTALAKSSNAVPRENCKEDTQESAQKHLVKNLNEIFKIQSTVGSAIVKPYGHYRYLFLLKVKKKIVLFIQTATFFQR